jgi:ATP-binding cassette, subfamily B, multidrug efflux pump
MPSHEEEPIGTVRDSRLLWRLLGYLRPYPVPFGGALIAVVVNSALQLAPPYLTKVAIDRGIAARDLAAIGAIARLYVLTLVAVALLECAQTYTLQLTSQRILFDLRLQVYRHLQRLDLQFFDRNPLGRLMARVTTDVEVLAEFFTSGVHAIFFDIFTLVGIVVVLLAMNPALALVTLAVLPLVAWLTQWFRTNVRESFREIRVWVGRISAFLQENLSGMATVKLFSREAAHAGLFRRLNERHRDANLKAVFYYAVFYPAIEIIATLATASILWYGGAGVLGGRLTLGSLVAFLLYAQRFFRPVADISEKLNGLQAALAASERIFALLDTPVRIQSPAAPIARPRTAGRIVFDRVSFGYQEGRDAIRDLSFDVSPGERVGIVGATGSGKSTIISLLLRLYDVRQGRILLDGVDIRRLDLASLRGLFGLVLQDVQLFSGSIASNIRLGNPAIDDEAVRRAAEAVQADRFIARLPGGYDSPVAERGATLSAGQKQLLSFARALAFDPPILVLDEATSMLDTETERMIREALDTAMLGRTTLAIAHRLATVQDMDKILVMHRGTLREAGSHRQLLRVGGVYRRLWDLQYPDRARQDGESRSRG